MEFLKEIITNFNRPKIWLFLANIFLVFFLILLFNTGALPIKSFGDFLFFVAIIFCLALYRPGWAFLFFIGTIALENINLAPEGIRITMRPYQLLGAVSILALAVRWILKRLNFELVKLKWFDSLPIIMAVAGFLSALNASSRGSSLKLSIVFASFVALYFLIRTFISTLDDLKKIIPFFLSSGIIITIYGIWQNIRFVSGLNPFETMPGRPNATFAEADWLGIYLVFLIIAIYSIIFYFNKKNIAGQSSLIPNSQFPISNKFLNSDFQIQGLVLCLLLTTFYLLLILTVSRSAWLGAAAATFVFLLLILTNLKISPREWQWKDFLKILTGVLTSVIISVGLAYFFHLTNFQLLNRAQSTSTGLQKITISCGPGKEAPEKIGVVEELEKFGCRHINLEEIEQEIGQNNIVKEIYRDDPNVNIRKEIYEKSWQEIKKHPILGIGWGSISAILGKDARPARIATPARSDAPHSGEQSVAGGGANLNASNIFLEVWLGAGIIGLLAFLALWIYIFAKNVANFAKTENLEEKVFTLFILSAWLGLTTANLFNSGILLGFLWLFLAVSLVEFKSNEDWN